MITNTNEDIPEITYPTWKENDLRSKLAEKAQARRLMKLFIRDLLDTEKTICTNKKTFSMNGITFSRILLQGTVISVDVRGALEPKTWVRIQDGTGCLDCIAKRRPELDALRSQTERQQEEAVHEFASKPNSSVLKASLMMLQSAKNNLEQVVRHSDFKLGDEVRLIGELSEYRGKRYCFVVSGVKVVKDEIDCDFISSYIEEIFELYSKFYVTKKL